MRWESDQFNLVAFLVCEGFVPQGFPHTVSDEFLEHPEEHVISIPNYETRSQSV